MCLKIRRSTPNSDLSHEHSTAGANQETLLQKQNSIREARTVFKTFFVILQNTGFCLQHMQAKKRKHMGNNEETVTLNIWYGKFSHLYAVTTPTKIQSIRKCEWGLQDLATD